jgi:hypothetical protein
VGENMSTCKAADICIMSSAVATNGRVRECWGSPSSSSTAASVAGVYPNLRGVIQMRVISKGGDKPPTR